MKSCRLYGGPYDGDTGEQNEPLAPAIWAYECVTEGCPLGIHWLLEPTDEVPTEEYKLGPDTGLVRLYVWADLELDPNSAGREKELVPA